jgi:hypothetical protein
MKKRVSPSFFALQARCLPSLTHITYLSKLIGILSFAAFLQHELFRGMMVTEAPSAVNTAAHPHHF